MPTATHIPAWQKLGLKLKKPQVHILDQQACTEQVVEAKTSPPSKKRPLSNRSENESEWPSQRLPKRTKHDQSASEVILNGITELNKKTAKSLPPKTSKSDRPQLQKRKSVSFGPDVKTDDGDSVKVLKNRLEQDEPPTPVAATGSNEPSSEQNKSKVKKKQKKKKKKSSPIRPKTTAKVKTTTTHEGQITPPHLTYLVTYHSKRSEWKFSKSQQNTLLKKLFEIDEVPSTYDNVLISYLQGLQGQEARNRLREKALDIRKADEESLLETRDSGEKSDDGAEKAEGMASSSDPDRERRQREAYEGCIAHLRTQLREKAFEREEEALERCGETEAFEQRWRKRKRAEIVLWCVGETAPAVSPPNRTILHIQMHPSRQEQQKQNSETEAPDNSWMWGRDARRIDSSIAGKSGKKVVFGDDGVVVKSEGEVPTARQKQNGAGGDGGGGVKGPAVVGKKKRTRRGKKRTGVPDDDDSSSSSSSDGEIDVKAALIIQKTNGIKVEAEAVKESQAKSSSSSDSSSDSSSSSSQDDSSDDSDGSDESG